MVEEHIFVIPWNVKADLQSLINQGDYKCTTENDSKTKKKITTCQVAYKNTGDTDFNGGVLTLTLNAKHAGNIIHPAIIATKVSNAITLTASPVNARSLSI